MFWKIKSEKSKWDFFLEIQYNQTHAFNFQKRYERTYRYCGQNGKNQSKDEVFTKFSIHL